MRMMGSMAILLCLAGGAYAGEVHTRTVAGTWASDPQRGTFNGAIPNDAGYSFWLTNDQVNLASPVTVIAQIRYKNHVDYGGAGVALVDPNASNQTQKHLRIELSEREDTAGVGGWLGNENHFSGSSKRASRDIKPGEWYEVAMKIEGTHATGFLDSVEVFSADVPELSQMPRTLVVAPFVVEADVEMRVIVRRGAQAGEAKPPAPTGPAKIASIEPYGHDDTDVSDVPWNARAGPATGARGAGSTGPFAARGTVRQSPAGAAGASTPARAGALRAGRRNTRTRAGRVPPAGRSAGGPCLARGEGPGPPGKAKRRSWDDPRA